MFWGFWGFVCCFLFFFWLTRTPSMRPSQVTRCSHLHFSPPVQTGHPVVSWWSPVRNFYSIFQILVKMWMFRRPVWDQDGGTRVFPRQKQWKMFSLAGRDWLELWNKPQSLVELLFFFLISSSTYQTLLSNTIELTWKDYLENNLSMKWYF